MQYMDEHPHVERWIAVRPFDERRRELLGQEGLQVRVDIRRRFLRVNVQAGGTRRLTGIAVDRHRWVAGDIRCLHGIDSVWLAGDVIPQTLPLSRRFHIQLGQQALGDVVLELIPYRQHIGLDVLQGRYVAEVVLHNGRDRARKQDDGMEILASVQIAAQRSGNTRDSDDPVDDVDSVLQLGRFRCHLLQPLLIPILDQALRLAERIVDLGAQRLRRRKRIKDGREIVRRRVETLVVLVDQDGHSVLDDVEPGIQLLRIRVQVLERREGVGVEHVGWNAGRLEPPQHIPLAVVLVRRASMPASHPEVTHYPKTEDNALWPRVTFRSCHMTRRVAISVVRATGDPPAQLCSCHRGGRSSQSAAAAAAKRAQRGWAGSVCSCGLRARSLLHCHCSNGWTAPADGCPAGRRASPGGHHVEVASPPPERGQPAVAGATVPGVSRAPVGRAGHSCAAGRR